MFSGRDADTSSNDSYQVGLVVGRILNADFDSWPEEQKLEYTAGVDHLIRKCAHATEYAVLGVLWFIALAGSIKKRAFLAWLITTAYAATDEIHQLFVPGRSGQITDVCIDSGGCVVGLLIAILIAVLISKRKGKA